MGIAGRHASAERRTRKISVRSAAVVVASAWIVATIVAGCSKAAPRETNGASPPVAAPRGEPLRPSTPTTSVPPTPTAAPAPVAAPAPAPEIPKHDGIEALTLDVLSSFPYAPPKPGLDAAGNKLPVGPWPDPVPKRIYDLDGRSISVEGYVIPLDYENETFSKFILAAFLPSCCFGDTIRPNQWIEVTMKDGKRVPFERGPNRVTGVLRIVSHDSADSATKLYLMTGEKLEGQE